ncbi:MAG: N-acetyl sugar amidotransferase [Candidatus Aureabacteria bacterium]|nr:N-acetyl sugar amidotransferase [Candidatus Auribacterota bacterium]
MDREYRICKRCIMDTTDPDISFDEQGICNHCREYAVHYGKDVFTGDEGKKRLDEIVARIRAKAGKSEHDSVMGLSGGVDSTYVAYLAKQLGLNPLCVHLDNGWDSELSVKNIENIVRRLGFDLHTHVIDWEEFKDLQLAYMKASVIDIEVPTDHAITAVLYDVAREQNISFILSGNNIATEGILPFSWVHGNKNDLINLKAIHRKFGSLPLKSYPRLGLCRRLYYHVVKKIRTVKILNYIRYNKKEAKRIITESLGWRDYGYKHYESFFTRFYQAYILTKKFGVDKRRAHLSTLICSGQMTREEALSEIQKELYNEDDLKNDKEYVLKKLGLSEKDFERIMALPVKSHLDYGSDLKIHRLIMSAYEKLKRFKARR